MRSIVIVGTFAAGLVALSTAAAAVPIHLERPHSSWPQAESDVPADPAIHFGALPNGMRYLIRKNSSPGGQVALRLRVAAGSLYEQPKDAGIAHFLEHMSFRGSKSLPDGQALKTLQDLGLSLGADLNAHTSADQTTFEFDLPRGDETTLTKGLTLVREIAGNLTLDPAALNSERKVVLAEARQSDTPGFHAVRAELAELFGARLGGAMLAIGNTKAIEAATAADMRQFYQSWYRPERATLVIVGDVDPARTEELVRKLFGDWSAAAPAPRAPAFDLPAPAAPQVRLYSEAGAPPAVSIDFIRPHRAVADTLAEERREIRRVIAIAALNERFGALARTENPPFIGAGARWNAVDGIADTSEIAASYAPGHAFEAVKALHNTLAATLARGVGQADIDQAVKNLRAFFEAQVASANSSASNKLASDYLTDIAHDGVITSPEQDLKEFTEFTAGLDAATVNAALKEIFTGVPPSLFVSSPSPITEDSAAFTHALTAVPVLDASAEQAVKPWPYGDFGAPGKVVSRENDAALGVTFVTFSNGVRATIRPAGFQKGQVLISARFGGGRLGLAKAQAKLGWALQTALLLGGLGKISPDEIEKTLAGHAVGAQLAIEADAFALNGATRPDDFATELQLLAAYISDPAFRPPGFARGRAGTKNQLAQLMTTPDGVLSGELAKILHGGDARYGAPSEADIDSTTLDDVKAMLHGPLTAAPLEIIVTGDITAETAIEGLARTFGALPARAVPQIVTGDESLPPAPDAPIVLHHNGSADQAAAVMVWPGAGIYPDPQTARTLRVLASVLSTRLFDEVRTAQGLTYTPQAASLSSPESPGYGYIEALADVPPGKIGAFYEAVEKAVADLRSKPVSEEELKRARDPMVNDLLHTRQSNRYWLGILGGANADRRRLALIENLIPDTSRVTPEDLYRAAQRYLSRTPYRIAVLPAGTNLPSAPAK